MKYLWFVLGVLFIISCIEKGNQDNRPNLVLIIADDLAWDDLGCYEHPTIQTPNIDRLAKEGMLFTHAFLTASSCSPSRASIITGKYPHQTGAEQLHWPLPAQQITFVESLKQAGYWTGQAGKWHLGDAVKDRFHKIMEVPVGGFQLKADGTMNTSTNESGCEDWIPILNSRDKTKPFFLWLAAVDPHRDYKEGIVENGHHTEDVVVPPYLPDNDVVRQDLALYYDEVTRLDNFVGELVEELDKQRLTENTLILFISDNGRPFPRDKTTLYDGGIKTPWIVKWPEKVKGNTQTDALISSIDIATTFLELAEVEGSSDFIGESFKKVLKNPEEELRTHIYAEDHWHDFEDYSRAVRDKQFKYIRNYYNDLPNTPSADALRSITFREMQQLQKKGELNLAQQACFLQPRPKEELYDVNEDPFELNNLADNPEYEEVLDGMRDVMDEIQLATKDELPEIRTPDEFDRESGMPNKFRIRPRPAKEEMWKVYKKDSVK